MSDEKRRHEDAIERLIELQIETQSWGYVSTGTRFKVFQTPGTARDVREKIDDAALVHRLTGVTPSVALHIPWDAVESYVELASYAEKSGLRIGSISPNLFQDDDYRLGSLANADHRIRSKAVRHVQDCIAIMRDVGSKQLSLWLADGTNYPGQGSFRKRRHWLMECLEQIYGALPDDMTLMLEYKFFEPAVYHTDVADWGQSLLLCQATGNRAGVLVDLGHHALGVNIEQIVATLLDERRLAGFDLNSKKYADDDLPVGVINPFELFLIAVELVSAERDDDELVARSARDVLYKIDQCAMIEEKIPAMLRSVTAMQSAFAKACLVDYQELSRARDEGDVIGANELLNEAYEADVRPLVAEVRRRLGASVDPLGDYLGSEERASRNVLRTGKAASW